MVCHSLLQRTMFYQKLSTMTRVSWVSLHSMAHNFIELHKAVIHVIILVSSLIVVFILEPVGL